MLLKSKVISKEYYRPIEVAKMLGCTSRTVGNYIEKGYLDAVRTDSNYRYISKESLVEFLERKQMLYDDTGIRRNIIYARVSTQKQKEKGDLARQVAYISEYLIRKNVTNVEIIEEIGSGLDDKRKQLLKVLDRVQNNEIDVIYVLYTDRLTRFGFNYLETLCKKHNTRIEVVSDDTDKTLEDELVEDVISILHSFSGKSYGLRRRVQEELEKGGEDETNTGGKNSV